MMLSGEQFPDSEMAFKTTRFIDKHKVSTHGTLPWRQMVEKEGISVIVMALHSFATRV